MWRTSGGEWVWSVWLDEKLVRDGSLGWGTPGKNVTLELIYETAVWRITVYLVGGPVDRREVSATISTISLEPVYEYAPTPWGSTLMSREYRGMALLDGTNVTVVAWCRSYRYCGVVAYVNESEAYSTSVALPDVISFEYSSTRLELSLEVPEPPVLNLAIEPRLEHVGCSVGTFPNGSTTCVNLYRFDETVRAGNTTVIIYGRVSRVEIDIYIRVFGVPPASYDVSIDGLWMEKSVEYSGMLSVYARYVARYSELIPENTVMRIVIEPLNLTVTILVKG